MAVETAPARVPEAVGKVPEAGAEKVTAAPAAASAADPGPPTPAPVAFTPVRTIRASGGCLVVGDIAADGRLVREARMSAGMSIRVVPLMVREIGPREDPREDGNGIEPAWIVYCSTHDIGSLEDVVAVAVVGDAEIGRVFGRILSRKIGNTTAPLWAQVWMLDAVGDRVDWAMRPNDRPFVTAARAMELRNMACEVGDEDMDGLLPHSAALASCIGDVPMAMRSAV